MENVDFESYQYPPYLFLAQVAEHCPKAVSTYMLLWRKVDDDCLIEVKKKDVRYEFLMSLAKFRHDLLLLVKEMLISIKETKEKIIIELVRWDNLEKFDHYGN